QVCGECGQLGGDNIRRNRVNGAHTESILRGDRGHDRGTVATERGERLEVRLNAGAAAGVRPRDRERDPVHAVSHFTSEPMALLSTIRDLHRRKGRERRGLALAEGIRLVEEMLAAGAPCKGVVVAPALEATPRGTQL